MSIRLQESTNLIVEDGIVPKEGKQLEVVIDVARIAHHDDAAKRLSGGYALVVNGEGGSIGYGIFRLRNIFQRGWRAR